MELCSEFENARTLSVFASVPSGRGNASTFTIFPVDSSQPEQKSVDPKERIVTVVKFPPETKLRGSEKDLADEILSHLHKVVRTPPHHTLEEPRAVGIFILGRGSVEEYLKKSNDHKIYLGFKNAEPGASTTMASMTVSNEENDNNSDDSDSDIGDGYIDMDDDHGVTDNQSGFDTATARAHAFNTTRNFKCLYKNAELLKHFHIYVSEEGKRTFWNDTSYAGASHPRVTDGTVGAGLEQLKEMGL